MTKSHKTMCGLAQAHVAALGPRVLGEGQERVLGYYLTIDELKALYEENNFNVSPRRTVIYEHIQNWTLCKWARVTGQDDNMIVWFKCPDGQNTWTNRQAERFMIPGPRVILDPFDSEVLA